MSSCFFGLSHRKTHCVCKVQHTPMVPCDPQTNSGNCFQWKRAIRNNTELVGWASSLCVYDCNRSAWSRVSVRPNILYGKEEKHLIEQDELARWRCQIYVKLFLFTQSGHRRTHLEEICSQAASWISLCVNKESLGICPGSIAHQAHKQKQCPLIMIGNKECMLILAHSLFLLCDWLFNQYKQNSLLFAFFILN